MARARVILAAEYFPLPTEGRPVAQGEVFVGIPDTDPEIEANRKEVTLIQEDGTEVPILPAGQPLMTGAGGVILYNGSPVQVFTEDAYSIKVLDDLGQQVYYFNEVENFIDISVPDLVSENFYTNDASSTSNAYAVVPPSSAAPYPDSLIDGQLICFRPSDPVTGPSTLNVLGDSGFIGAEPIRMPDGVNDLPDNIWPANTDVEVRWDEAGGQFIYQDNGTFVNDYGIPDWSNIVDYSKVPAYVTGTDGNLYKSLQESGPNLGGAQDPVSEPTFWEQIIENQDIPNTALHQSGILIANNNADPVFDIDFTEGNVRDIDDTVDIVLASLLTKQLNANWTEGNSNGGAASTILPLPGAQATYNCFVIAKDDGTVDAGFDNDADGFNLLADAAPSGYTKIRRRGKILWDGGSIVAFFQDSIDESRFWLNTPVTSFIGSITGAGTNIPLNLPSDVVGEFAVSYAESAGGGISLCVVTETRAQNVPPTASLYDLQSALVAGSTQWVNSAQFQRYLDSGSQIRVRTTSAGNNTIIVALAWHDDRRN